MNDWKLILGHLRAGFDLVLESLNLMNNVYGAVHSDMAQCMRLLARLSYILGDPAEALSQQHKATLMSERCNGLDSANTVVEYVSHLLCSISVLQNKFFVSIPFRIWTGCLFL